MTNSESTQIALRLPTPVVKRLDNHTEKLRKQHPGMKVTRADAHRMLLIDALDRAERDAE